MEAARQPARIVVTRSRSDFDGRAEGQRLAAFVVPKDSGPSEDEVKSYVKENLAKYKVPRDVEFLDELPRNATGKVVKRDLVKSEDDQ